MLCARHARTTRSAISPRFATSSRRITGLPGRPAGAAAFEEGAQPLLALVTRSPLCDPSCRLGPIRAVEDEAFRVAYGPRAGSAELSEDPLQRACEVGGDLMDEADAKCGRGVETLARDEVAAGGALADLAQRERGDHCRNDPELDLREP